ncbi:DNA-binding protein [Wenyingzhuangia sp. 2_MG-2023]|uniref:DNA-binding protein n=1 Tax=Wenyingzhuangia sp. 2_MG-2023 TaxID=3062639 RepID=UPI0026E2A71B|nr:DNA-binding protein [Wenyingzhuangia sp. 2_MG-2023]MDO6739043.1 DNA-binding protein [Wenyingzhuangia sp. 2_MG-2023]MDO6803755.1 DNA-binding protein [Wenyingzhuangia sp. 1_MG-2023]
MEEFEVGQEVEVVVGSFTKLGITVLVNEVCEGLLYANEVYQRVEEGQRIKGYVKKVREDGKLDVSLQPIGFRNSITKFQVQILNALRAHNGFLPITDKSEPDTIKFELGMSKKAFKNAIGGLYKNRVIAIEENGIRLLEHVQ